MVVRLRVARGFERCYSFSVFLACVKMNFVLIECIIFEKFFSLRKDSVFDINILVIFF